MARRGGAVVEYSMHAEGGVVALIKLGGSRHINGRGMGRQRRRSIELEGLSRVLRGTVIAHSLRTAGRGIRSTRRGRGRSRAT